MKKRSLPPDWLEVNGNNGGSYVRLEKTDQDGFCRLEVGETCIRTISCVISVTALAAILTSCRDAGFDEILKRYYVAGGGSPEFAVDRDPITGPWRGPA